MQKVSTAYFGKWKSKKSSWQRLQRMVRYKSSSQQMRLQMKAKVLKWKTLKKVKKVVDKQKKNCYNNKAFSKHYRQAIQYFEHW